MSGQVSLVPERRGGSGLISIDVDGCFKSGSAIDHCDKKDAYTRLIIIILSLKYV